MAPEQIRGREVDQRVDIYALGAILFEMITGRPPFQRGTDFDILQAHIGEQPLAPSAMVRGLPPWIDQVVLRALAKHPSERFETVSEMRRHLASRHDVASEATRATSLPKIDLPSPQPTGPTTTHSSWPAMKSGKLALGAVLAILITVLLVASNARQEAGAPPTPSPLQQTAPASTPLALAMEISSFRDTELPSVVEAQTAASVYSDLAEDSCQTTEFQEEDASSVQRCPGVAGYNLMVLDSDARMSITVVDPDGREHPLDFWKFISSNFSSVGAKAEWRIVSRNGIRTPIGLIVRFNVANSNSSTSTSFLTVSKIDAAETCLTDIVPPSRDANQRARDAADSAAEKPCLENSFTSDP